MADAQERVVEAIFDEINSAVELLISIGYHRTALVVLYSGIDVAAWLRGTNDSVNRQDFLRWVDDFLLPHSDLRCTAVELYAARCGIVHTMAAVSDLSRRTKGNVRALNYAVGDAPVSPLRDTMRASGRDDLVGVHLSDLTVAFARGIEVFLSGTAKEPIAWRKLLERSRHVLALRPSLPSVGAFAEARGL